jgi:hypothetical protein
VAVQQVTAIDRATPGRSSDWGGGVQPGDVGVDHPGLLGSASGDAGEGHVATDRDLPRHVDHARLVAEQAISPTKSPPLRVATRLPLRMTWTFPSTITKNSRPTSFGDAGSGEPPRRATSGDACVFACRNPQARCWNRRDVPRDARHEPRSPAASPPFRVAFAPCDGGFWPRYDAARDGRPVHALRGRMSS